MAWSSKMEWKKLVIVLICCNHVGGFCPAPQRIVVARTWVAAGGNVNGDSIPIVDNIDLTAELDPDALMPLAPPLTFDKYLTMQVNETHTFLLPLQLLQTHLIHFFFYNARTSE
jgi:hypothetical protein